jgi:RHS repeat-associated protein
MHGRRRQGRRADGGPPKGPPTSLASVGNILTKHHEGSNPLTMSYDAANRLTTSLLGTTQLTTYTYSNAGEMTEERCDSLGIRATFVYDGEHRCVNEIRATTHSYTYAFDGLRRSAHMAGTANAISFVWDGTDLLNEYVSGALSGRYLTLDGEVLSEKRGASRYVYGVDPLGSVVHLLDSGLNRAATYVYWPYGEVQSHTGVDTPMQYIGNLGYYTATTNRLYVRARWLRPDLGRWATEDPIRFAGRDLNLYAYVGSHPTSGADPSGEGARGNVGCLHMPNRKCIDVWLGACAGDPYCREVLRPLPQPRVSMCVEPPGADYSCSEQQHWLCQRDCELLHGVGNGIHVCTRRTGCRCIYWLIDIGPAEVFIYAIS